MFLDGLRNTLDSICDRSLDTTFVVFALGIELGGSLYVPDVAAGLLFVTTLMVLILPYFLGPAGARPEFVKWLSGRVLVAVLAVAIGTVLKPSYGIVLPAEARFIPLTILIITAAVSCSVQFYGLMRLRLAK